MNRKDHGHPLLAVCAGSCDLLSSPGIFHRFPRKTGQSMFPTCLWDVPNTLGKALLSYEARSMGVTIFLRFWLGTGRTGICLVPVHRAVPSLLPRKFTHHRHFAAVLPLVLQATR